MLEKQIKAPPRARNFFTMHIKPSQRFFFFFFFCGGPNLLSKNRCIDLEISLLCYVIKLCYLL